MNPKPMSPDQAIDRLITGLATTEAPPAMEQRLLNALQSRATAHRRKWFAVPSIFTRPQPWAIAAGLIIVSLAGSMGVRRRHEPAHDNAVLKHDTPPHTATTPQIAGAKPEGKVALSASRPRRDVAPEDINDFNAMAIIEMNAPSRPAPPLPLTHQEKLLAVAVDRVGPEKLSSLRPEVRARQMELSKAEFRTFFEPQPAKDSE